MPLSPADFYAYSQATGASVADTPEKRAKQAPEVLAFRQQQLQAPKQGPSLLDVLGGAALLAGVSAGGYGIARALRNRGAGQAVKTAVIEDLGTQAAQNVRRAASYGEPAPSKVATPGAQPGINRSTPLLPGEQKPNLGIQLVNIQDLTNSLPKAQGTLQLPAARQDYLSQIGNTGKTNTPYSLRDIAQLGLSHMEVAPELDTADRLLREYELGRQQRQATRIKAAEELRQGELRSMGDKIIAQLKGESLVEQQLTALPQTKNQSLNALGSSEDQMTGRVKNQLQRNEDLDLSQIEVLEDIAAQNRNWMMEQDEPINHVARQLPDGLPIDQVENTRPLSSQELADIAKSEMMSLRAELEGRGLRPGTQRFENALAQSWTTKSISGATPGTQKFRDLQDQGKIDVSLPKTIRNAVEAVSAGSSPTGFIPERTVTNIGPDAVITSTAAGTAIRGASPVYYETLPKSELRQAYGKGDPLIYGVPDENIPDLPGSLRLRGGRPPEAALGQLSKQEIMFSALDRPVSEAAEPAGGSAGIGVYGVEPNYVPGAVSKLTGEYSAAATGRPPTYVPAWLQKKEMKSGFETLNTSQLMSAAEKTKVPRIQNALQSEINRRQTTEESLALSEVLRRARIEGRNPQTFLQQYGGNL